MVLFLVAELLGRQEVKTKAGRTVGVEVDVFVEKFCEGFPPMLNFNAQENSPRTDDARARPRTLPPNWGFGSLKGVGLASKKETVTSLEPTTGTLLVNEVGEDFKARQRVGVF
jgi:hypothetical protein